MQKEELLRQIVEILRQDGEHKTDGECLEEVAELLEREEGLKVYDHDNTPHHTDPDPTPAHGTPRPQAHPCSVPFCDYFTATPRHFCSGHASVIGNAPHLLAFAEGWLFDHTDPDHSADLLALRFFTSCLDVIHAFVIGHELGEGALVETALRTGSLLLGRVACDTCGDNVDPEELDVNGMCEHCREEAEHA